MSAIEVEGLGKRYGERAALRGVAFAVRRGDVVALLGPNGAGKTTTLEILEGFQAPSEGRVRVLGAEPRRGGRAWRARLGLVMQSTSLDPQLTVREALTAFAAAYAAPRPVAEVLALVDLEAEAGTRIGRLSGGQQRRVDLGLGLVGRPELLFLDEPTTGLDPAARRRTWAVVERLREGGATVLLTTHYLEEAERLADRLLVLSGGRLVADATPAQLRAGAAPATIRWPLPAGTGGAALPDGLRAHLDADGRELLLRTRDPGPALGELVGWARAAGLDLGALEVGPASLEDAYLALTGAEARDA